MNIAEFPSTIQIELTNICNGGCTTCSTVNMKRKRGIMDFGLFKKIINELNKENYNGIIFPFLDGESLLVPNVIDYLSYMRSKLPKSTIILYTNGSMLDENVSEAIIKENLLDEIILSFDGGTREAFESIRKNLSFDDVYSKYQRFVNIRNKLKKNKPKVLVNMVICKENKHTVNELKMNFYFVDGFKLSTMHENSTRNYESEKQNNRLSFLSKCNFCVRLNEWFHIHYNGDVCLCCNDYEGEEILGNLNNSSIRDIWYGEEYQKKRNYLMKRDFSKLPLCRDCSFIKRNIIIQQCLKILSFGQNNFPNLTQKLVELYAKNKY